MLTAAVLPVAIAAFALASALALYRLLRGPSVSDRILALDTLYVNSLALLVLLGLRDGSTLGFEAALVIALIGFVGTVALARYADRGTLIE
jgi:multicomponent K+:H+ antiporter subunit F